MQAGGTRRNQNAAGVRIVVIVAAVLTICNVSPSIKSDVTVVEVNVTPGVQLPAHLWRRLIGACVKFLSMPFFW